MRKRTTIKKENLKQSLLETEHNTTLLLETDPNYITEDNFLNVEEFTRVLKHTNKSCPAPAKISYQLISLSFAFLFPA